MAISLNNHESRIVALENKTSQISGVKAYGCNYNNVVKNVTKDSNERFTINTSCVLFVLAASTPNGSNRTQTLYKNGSAIVSSQSGSSWSCRITSAMINMNAGDRISVNWGGGLSGTGRLIAIGYLISDRILKYAYACKSLLFTPLRKIGGVK